MIYVTGDTHGSLGIARLQTFLKSHPKLTKSDYVIIAGDFGAVWQRETLDEDLQPYEMLPFTVLFVDGNHENFDLLNSFPVEKWNCGKVHFVRPNIIHLMRGQVYVLDGNKIFTFGGATSTDRCFRKEGVSWWSSEMPSFEELDEGIANLKKYGNKVDYIIAHSCCERALMYPPLRTRNCRMGRFPENQMLSYFDEIADYKHFYFGHYHMDGRLSDKYTVLYEKIIPLGG